VDLGSGRAQGGSASTTLSASSAPRTCARCRPSVFVLSRVQPAVESRFFQHFRIDPTAPIESSSPASPLIAGTGGTVDFSVSTRLAVAPTSRTRSRGGSGARVIRARDRGDGHIDLQPHFRGRRRLHPLLRSGGRHQFHQAREVRQQPGSRHLEVTVSELASRPSPASIHRTARSACRSPRA